MKKGKKCSTHKIITNAVHIVSLIAIIFIFFVWKQGTVTDAPSMLQYIAWIEITNLAQYSVKSGYEHTHGIFDNPITNAVIQASQNGDIASGIQQVGEALKTINESDNSAESTETK